MSKAGALADLVAGVDLLCLDAGNTVIFLDHERLAALLGEVAGRSCDPNLLVRTEGDAKRLADDWGYRLVSAQPVDMFPHTPHVETVALLTHG